MSTAYAKALHYGGHDGLPEIRRKREVVFTLGSDAQQMLGAWVCWRRWGWEEHGVEIDDAGFVSEFMAKCQSGTFAQIVGWDGPEPVAIVELRTIYDSMLSRTTLYGDHAWVHPDYRQQGLMREIVAYCIATAKIMGVRHWVVPVTAGDEATAPFLKSTYEAFGFRLSGITMKQEID